MSRDARADEEFKPIIPHRAPAARATNPTHQTTTGWGVSECVESGCHAPSDSLTAQHRSIRGHKLATCGACHAAHTWKTGRTECESCHTGISDPAVRVRRPPGAGDDPQPDAQALKSGPALTPERSYHSAPPGRAPPFKVNRLRAILSAMAFAPSCREGTKPRQGEVALAQRATRRASNTHGSLGSLSNVSRNRVAICPGERATVHGVS